MVEIMENKETRQKKDGEDMKKGRYADGQSKPVDANSENIIEEKDIIKEKLESINPLEITPMEALNILYELKNEMKKQEKK